MLQPSRPRLNVEYITAIPVVSFVDSDLLAEEVIHEASLELLHLVDEQGTIGLVIDFRDVRYMSSTMVAQLVQVHRKLTKKNGRLKLCGLIPSLRAVFRISQLDRMLAIHDDVHAALDAF